MKPSLFVLLASVMFSATACVGAPEEPTFEDPEEDIDTASQALGVATKVVGDTSCPAGYSLATTDEALANTAATCAKLGTWDIARLDGGGSMDGPGYGCVIRDADSRTLGHALCGAL
jgi:hypothetical protein